MSLWNLFARDQRQATADERSEAGPDGAVPRSSSSAEENKTEAERELEHALEQATVVIDGLRKELEAAKAESAEGLAKAKQEHQAAVVSAVEAQKKAIEELKAQHQSEVTKLKAQFKHDLENAIKTYHSVHEKVVLQKENEINELNSELKRATTPAGFIENILGISPRKKRKRPCDDDGLQAAEVEA